MKLVTSVGPALRLMAVSPNSTQTLPLICTVNAAYEFPHMAHVLVQRTNFEIRGLPLVFHCGNSSGLTKENHNFGLKFQPCFRECIKVTETEISLFHKPEQNYDSVLHTSYCIYGHVKSLPRNTRSVSSAKSLKCKLPTDDKSCLRGIHAKNIRNPQTQKSYVCIPKKRG